MSQEPARWHRPRTWILLVGIIILLIFLAFYRPFESYLVESIPNVHFHNVVFWFASLVAVIAYAVAHWQSFRRHIVRAAGELDVTGLVFDTLQVAVLIAVILSAGATLQAIEMLSEHLIDRGPIIDAVFGGRIVAIVLLVILTILFCLLHYAIRAFRSGWQPRRAPPRAARPSSSG